MGKANFRRTVYALGGDYGQEYDLIVPERALSQMECFSQWFIAA
jgi:hypothetical protein